MKKLTFLFFLIVCAAESAPRDMLKYAPQNTFFLTAADFASLRTNTIFASMEQKGQIWSEDEDSDLPYFKMLKVNPRQTVTALMFSKYLNPYGVKGTIRIFEINGNAADLVAGKPETKYLGASLYRLAPDLEWYAVVLGPSTLAFGSLAETKNAVDLGAGKLPGIAKNAPMQELLQKIPQQAGIWGAAVPLTRQQASEADAGQTTNAVMQAFRNYYFFGVPAKNTGNAHFFGETLDDKEAVFANTFLIGLLTFAKVRAPEDVAAQLDDIQVDRNGKQIHVHGIVTKQMVDAYFKGQLGVQ